MAVLRDRRAVVPDPYNPTRTIPAPTWAGAVTVTLDVTAWVGTPSVSALSDPARSATSANASLYTPADSDVKAGDRIRVNGHAFIVQAVPMAASNPWTGWTPPLEIPLEEVTDQ